MRLTGTLAGRLGRQVQLLTSVERNSDVVTRRFVQAFNRRAEFAIRRKQAMTLLPVDRHAIGNALVDSMVSAYVHRMQLVKKQAPGLQLSFSSEVSRLAKSLNIDLNDTRASFEWYAKPRVGKTLDGIEDRVNGILSDIVSKQYPTTTAVREMRRELDEAGISNSKPAVVETLVRTHSQIAFSTAQYDADQDDPFDIIWGYRYSTVGDDRVRDEHADMEGVTAPKDDPIWDTWWPPNGWNCRCQLVPILNDDKNPPKRTVKMPDGDPDDGFNLNIGKMLRAS